MDVLNAWELNITLDGTNHSVNPHLLAPLLKVLIYYNIPYYTSIILLYNILYHTTHLLAPLLKVLLYSNRLYCTTLIYYTLIYYT